AISRLSRRSTSSQLTWWQGDVADFQQVQCLFAEIKPDYVFNLASEVTGSRDLTAVMPTFRANLESAVNLLVAATLIGTNRVVLTGSLEEPEGDVPFVVPASPYAAAKWAASGYARLFHALYRTPAVLARLFMVYGPGQSDLRKLVPYVSLSLLKGQAPKLSSGTRPVDWVYIDDVVSGLLLAGSRHDLEGQTVDIGSGTLITVREVVRMLCQIANTNIAPEYGALQDRPMEQVRKADVRATQNAMAWMPRTSIRSGLEQTFAWYKHQIEVGVIP
ncbi:MAG: NAD-dependent epimerase/dehydratase family protein, partial [Gammaproteobacteria bacterium]|nr:NAD-dependent epimerase/dehydratase family protein [Gammaproteobacteria bacterium]